MRALWISTSPSEDKVHRSTRLTADSTVRSTEITSTRQEMYNQGPTIGRINLSFDDPDDQDPSLKPRMGQPLPPPYQEQPNAGYYGPGPYPNPSGYPSQPYGAPGGPYAPQGSYVLQVPYAPQGPYAQQQPYPGMPAYPQRPNADHTGVTVQPTVFMTSTSAVTPVPDYLGYSIFTMLFCCCPLGLAAIFCSCSVSIHSHFKSIWFPHNEIIK